MDAPTDRRQVHLTQTVLSPLAITVRDQTLLAMQAVDTERVRAMCGEVLEANTIDIPLDSSEMKAVVASVVEGVHAAVAWTRADMLQMAMHAVARYASSREGTDPTVVAAVICDAASVIEVDQADRQLYLDSMIQAVLTACDHLLGPEREELATFLRNALPVFFEKRNKGDSDEPAQREPDAS
ncbi:MAG: hypothetical protein CMJ31_09200 [Phycisphaerae bacterium]|nr:hypothetical protein [Phycisphaerae bacterium]